MIEKKALKKALLSSITKLIGVGLGAGAGSLLHQLMGNGFESWGTAIGMAILSFILMTVAEYERETE